jgi:hypothetical protein
LNNKNSFADPYFDPLETQSQRILAIGGLLLVASGMLFGNIFAVFILHPTYAAISEAMYAAAQLIPSGNVEAIVENFMAIGGFLENKGTKVDTHSHIIHSGYIALLLAMIQPWVALPAAVKRRLSWVFIISASLLPPSIFSIHYIGTAYSPLDHIGWGNILAYSFGAAQGIVMLCFGWGVWRHVRNGARKEPVYLGRGEKASRYLLVGGLLLLVSGFLYGAGYAAWLKTGVGANEVALLKAIVNHAALADQALLQQDFQDYGQLQLIRGINRASHAHTNEMGILLMLMAFVQPFIFFQASTRLRWAKFAVGCALLVPIGIALEIPYGRIGSFIVDSAGLGLTIALMAMIFGLLRYTGAQDQQQHKEQGAAQ